MPTGRFKWVRSHTRHAFAKINHEEKKTKGGLWGAQADFIREIGLPTAVVVLGIPADTDLRVIADSTVLTPGCCKRLTYDEIYEILKERGMTE